MTKWISGSTCAAALLSVTLAAAQTAPPQATSQPTQSNRGRVPDKPSTTSEAAKGKQQAIIPGCVVRDAANGGDASIASNGISYRLTGKDEKELEQYLGRRVEVTGLLESGSTGARATNGKANVESSIPPKDQTATGGQSDVTATGTPARQHGAARCAPAGHRQGDDGRPRRPGAGQDAQGRIAELPVGLWARAALYSRPGWLCGLAPRKGRCNR